TRLARYAFRQRDFGVPELGESVLPRLVVVSNRVSVPSGDGAKRAGGLEVALRPALERNGGVWFGWSGKAVPRADVEMHTVHHKLGFGLFRRRERGHFPFGSRYGAEFLYCLG